MKKSASLELALGQLGVHDHVCLLYETHEEQLRTMVHYFRIGLARGERCIYCADAFSNDALINALAREGIDVAGAEAAGSLIITTQQEVYHRNDQFDPDEMIRFLSENVRISREDGFPALRLAGEIINISDACLIEYEVKLNDFFATNEVLAICLYDLNWFPPTLIRDVIHTHPIIIFRDMVCRNFYHIPPEQFIRTGASTGEIDRLMAKIVDRERTELLLRESEQRYRELVEALPAAVYSTDADGRITLYNDACITLWGRKPDPERDRWSGALRLFQDGVPIPPEECPMATAVREGRPIRGMEGILERPDGSIVHYVAYPTPLSHSGDKSAGAVNIIVDITERKQVETALCAKQEQLAAMAVELSLAEERERRRIASELHDHIGQTLLLGKLRLGMLADATGSGTTGGIVEEVLALLEQAIRDTRSLTQQLAPPLLAGAGLEAALEWLGKRMESDYALQVIFSDDRKVKTLTDEVRCVLFQSARELLINVAKHSGVKSAELSVTRDGEELHLRVTDRGVGFDRKAFSQNYIWEGGVGLFNIQHRIRLLGGAFSVVSRPDRGTEIILKVPLAPSSETTGQCPGPSAVRERV